jgi:hypothetical protein
MRAPYTCPLTRSLPFFLAALAMACSSNDEPKSSLPGANGNAVPEDRGASAAGGSSNDGEPRDDDAGDADDAGGSDMNAHDDANSGASASGLDSDGDGLADSVETNTHVFRGRNDTGTDPHNKDTDDDGLSDGDEVLGTEQGLDLPQMGTNPLRQDILLEYDWFEDRKGCDQHSHRPRPAALERVSATFAAAPHVNPDGSRGINVIHDYGQDALFSGGNRLVDEDGDDIISNGVDGPEYDDYRLKNFAPNREGYFHYVLMAHRYSVKDQDTGKLVVTDSSGQAKLPGYKLLVTMICDTKSDFRIASTIVHELGHNLGLRHGGDADVPNWKPNYNSVMNYLYQWDGVDTNCTPPGDGVIDYSRNQRIVLDEAALDEHEGMCGSPAVDWNKNQLIESGVSMDLTRDGALTVLQDHDDWSAVDLNWHRQSPLEKRDVLMDETVTCDNPPPGY